MTTQEDPTEVPLKESDWDDDNHPSSELPQRKKHKTVVKNSGPSQGSAVESSDKDTIDNPPTCNKWKTDVKNFGSHQGIVVESSADNTDNEIVVESSGDDTDSEIAVESSGDETDSKILRRKKPKTIVKNSDKGTMNNALRRINSDKSTMNNPPRYKKLKTVVKNSGSHQGNTVERSSKGTINNPLRYNKLKTDVKNSASRKGSIIKGSGHDTDSEPLRHSTRSKVSVPSFSKTLCQGRSISEVCHSFNTFFVSYQPLIM